MDGGEWKKPGRRIQEFVNENDIIDEYFGWVNPAVLIPGSVKLPPKSHGMDSLSWDQTLAGQSRAISIFDNFPISREELEQLHFASCISFVGLHGDTLKIGSFAIAQKVSGHCIDKRSHLTFQK